jgi:hypothetical protein
MSMILVLAALRDEELQGVIENPGRAFELIAPDDVEAVASPNLADLDKAWHGIHYLLTGTAWGGDPPLNSLLVGGSDVPDPDQEWGYGPPRCVWAADALAFARAFETVSDDQLSARFDPPDMMAKGIYPEIWNRDPSEDDTLGYLMEYVVVLRKFLRSTAAQNKGVLIGAT